MTVLTMIAVAGVPLASIRRELQRRAEHHAAFLAIDGNLVVRTANLPRHPIYSHFENHAPEQVCSVAVTQSDFSDKDVFLLLGYENLQDLALINTQITDTGLVELAKLPNLKQISIGGPGITEEGLARFGAVRPDVNAQPSEEQRRIWARQRDEKRYLQIIRESITYEPLP